MKMTSITRIALILVLAGGVPMLRAPAAWAQTATLSGIVTDKASGESLLGVNVGVADTALGTTTDLHGNYRLDLPSGTQTLVFSYIGFKTQRFEVTPGTATLNVALEEDVLGFETIVISVSGRSEKALEAPASITRLNAREIAQEVTPSSVSVLRNTVGVDVSQTGLDRRELVLRGFNNAFSGETYVLTDYRQAAVAALGANVYSLMPIASVDLDHIEIVRGPGSALYGAGVDAGVVHFFTKDPFTHPGTTLSISGAERSFFAVQYRHAGVVNNRLGYKIVGAYAQGDDWELDLDDPEDRRQTAFSNELVPRDTDVWKLNVGGTIQYKIGDGVTLTANGGFASVKTPVLTEAGTAQGDGFGYTFGQVRLQAGSFFAQAYLNRNDGGDSFVYGRADPDNPGQPAPLVDKGILFNAQAQYNFLDLAGGKEDLVVGVEFDMTRPDTEGTIIGRNEDDDTISEIGGYIHSTTALSEKLNLVLAVRGDYNNVQEAFTLSPRAAFVFKPTPGHTLRATYNRAFSSPGINSNFLDLRASETSFGPEIPYKLVFQGRGAFEGFTFDAFRDSPTARFFLPVEQLFGQDIPLGFFPVTPVYGVTAAGFAACASNPEACPAPFNAWTPQQRLAYAQLLGAIAQASTPAATAQAVLGIPDDSPLGYRPVGGPVDIDPLDQTITQTVEVGYKGLIGNRLLVAVDGYYTRKENFIAPLSVESPLAFLPPGFLAGDVQTLIATDPQAGGAFANFLAATGLSPEQAVPLLVGTFGSTPAAVVQPDQPVLSADSPPTEVGGLLSYRNFGQVEFFGVDASFLAHVGPSSDPDRLSVFGNVSLISDDFFDNEELGEENADLSLALNAPTFKAKGGVNVTVSGGFSVNVSGRYTEGFPVQSGSYVGDIDSYFLLDAGAGYAFDRVAPGLRLDVTVQNVLNNEHREFIGAPRIGRFAMARLTYTIR